ICHVPVSSTQVELTTLIHEIQLFICIIQFVLENLDFFRSIHISTFVDFCVQLVNFLLNSINLTWAVPGKQQAFILLLRLFSYSGSCFLSRQHWQDCKQKEGNQRRNHHGYSSHGLPPSHPVL